MILLNQGDSYSFIVKFRTLTDLSQYTCTYQITDDATGTIVDTGAGITTIHKDSDAFLVVLKPVISETLAIGNTYTIAAQLSSNDGLFRNEVKKQVKIIVQAVA